MKLLKTGTLFIICSFSISNGYSQTLESKIDTLLSNVFESNAPGATALVARNSKVIYRKAFGMANIELDVPMKPEGVFEVRSITKQFTAVSILMLLEQGKLSLDDKITKFLPDYPTHGKTISVRHLLTHTSGIKNYVGIKSFASKVRITMTPSEMIDFFKNEPMDFDPGERFQYSNSGYFILGYIIEILSGKSYGTFVEENIFEKIGMTSSLYGNRDKLIKNRVAGYQNNNGLTNSNYLDFSLSYSAGGLMTNVDDLLKWQEALNNNSLLKEETIKKAFANYTLDNGNPINYGFGWFINELNGIPSLEHGGSYLGFNSIGIYVPSEEVYVVVMSGCDCSSTEGAAVKIAALAVGKPYPELDSISLTQKQLQRWVGVYEFEDVVRFVSLKNGQLYSRRDDRATGVKIYPVSSNKFYFQDSFVHYEFSEENGRKVAFIKERLHQSKGLETNETLLDQK